MPGSAGPALTSEIPGGEVAPDTTGSLAERLRNRSARVAVLGLGYAGLPMAVELARAGYAVTGLDIDAQRVLLVNAGRSPVSDVADSDVAALVRDGYLQATTDSGVLSEADCALICVPTPLTPDRQPDLRFVQGAAAFLAAQVHPGMLVVLQSTCSPGTTRRVLVPALEQSGLRVGEDVFVAFAPERIDPGNQRYTVRNTPKLVGGITPRCTDLAMLLFAPAVERVVAVSSPEVAEMAKLIENTFRFINISFVNEMAILCDHMDVSVWEVMAAAGTKPFGFMTHYPGPGVGGDCIPVVPFFLEAAAHEHEMVAELIEVSGRINDEMPRFVVDKLERLLVQRGLVLDTARVLLLGMAYKADVSDTRESASLRVLELLRERGVDVAYHDPYVPEVRCEGTVIPSLPAEALAQGSFDGAVLLTAHSGVDYQSIAREVTVFFDTRNLPALEGPGVVRL